MDATSEDVAPIRILHVDDDSAFGELTATFLDRLQKPLEVVSVTSAADGLGRLEATPFDCIVSDYQMPGMDGLEFLEVVRRTWPELPFILFTGKGSEEIASEAISAGVTDYLQKAAGSEQYELLANRIENAVIQRRAQHAVARTQRRYRKLIQEASDVIAVVDPAGEFEYVSPAAERVFGYEPSVLVGETCFDYIHPEDRPAAEGQFRAFVDDGDRNGPATFRFQHPDGTWAWIEARSRNLLDDPLIDGIVVYARNVSSNFERCARMEALVEHASDVLTVVNHDGTVQYGNPAVEAVLGYPPEELVGQIAFELIHPEDREAAMAVMAETIETPGRVSGMATYRFKHRDGSWVWLESVGYADETPYLEGYVVSSREVTDRIEREQRFRAVFEEAFDAMVIANDDGEYIDVNDAASELFGLPEEELLGHRVTDFAPSDFDFAAAWEEFQAGSQERGTFPLVRSNGETRQVEYAATADIVPGEHLSIMRDVTDRIERERELDRQRILLKAQQEAVLDGILVVNESREMISYNQQFLDLWNLPESVALSGVERDALPYAFDLLEHPEEFEAELDHLYAHPTETSRDEIHLTDGRVFDRYSAPLLAEDGTVYGRLWTFRDITERTEHAAELERQNERLEEFASIVSHDLRNPLTVVEGSIALAEETGEAEHFERARRATDRMNRLIEDLLTLAREGETVAAVEPVDLAQLTTTCWDGMETASARLVVDVDHVVRADRSRLQQLVENLIRNAVQHGGDDVEVTVGALDDGFFIEDDGPGIDPALREDVFEAGFSTLAAGTGFGLRIVKQVADAHDWTVEATESAAGGARFEFHGLTFDGTGRVPTDISTES